MNGPILHAYDASPFTQRALRLFGIKNLDWRWVETPMMPPKDDLLLLTGGYRGTPVLQFGSDVYVDSQLIAMELERRYPLPALFPSGRTGLDLALVKWSDAFFRSALHIVLALQAASWPEAFRKDRERVFADIDFSKAGHALDDSRAQFRAHAYLLEQQLADGRAFLGGDSPGLPDSQVYPVVWLMRAALPDVTPQLLRDLPQLAAWEGRVAELGEGRRTRIDAGAALEEALRCEPVPYLDIDPYDAQALTQGMRVRVSADDTRRGEVEGEVTVALPNRISVRRSHPRIGTVVVHFPRLGYRVARL